MEQQQPQTDRTLNKMRDTAIPARVEDVAYDARAKLNAESVDLGRIRSAA
jgi:hypothetical protein